MLAGQANLIDKLTFRASEPLVSRVSAISLLRGLNRDGILHYINHHLKVVGIKNNLFDDTAGTATHQRSGGY